MSKEKTMDVIAEASSTIALAAIAVAKKAAEPPIVKDVALMMLMAAVRQVGEVYNCSRAQGLVTEYEIMLGAKKFDA